MTETEKAWRAGFEHAIRGGQEANGKMSMFQAPLVLYFDDPKEREEFIKEWMAEHPSHHSVPVDRHKGN